MKLSKILFLFILVTSHYVVSAQSRQVPNLLYFDNSKYHFGFLLGANQMLFTIKTADDFDKKMYYNNSTIQQMPDLNCDSAQVFNIEGRSSFGFVIGIIGNLRINDKFDFRFTPSLAFGERRLEYDILQFDEGNSSLSVVNKDIQSTYIDFPLYIKYKGARIHNARPYVFAGGKYTLDLASNAKKKDNLNAGFVFLNRHDVHAFGGAGFDFYTAYFKLGVEISMTYGFLDVVSRDVHLYTESIEKLSSKVFQLSFTFE